MNEPTKTIKVSAGTRVYYLDAYTDAKGQEYAVISEVPSDTKPGQKKRQRIIVHANCMERFTQAVDEMRDYMLRNKQ